MRKIVYQIIGGDFQSSVIFEDREVAANAIFNLRRNEEEEGIYTDYELKRLILTPKACSHCGHFELLTIPDREPYAPVHYLCPQCDSTFGAKEDAEPL